VQIFRLLNVHDRRNVICAEAVDQDDLALAGQLLDQLTPVPCRPNPRGNGDQKPDQRLPALTLKDRQQRRL
jgi:hypothetical protein